MKITTRRRFARTAVVMALVLAIAALVMVLHGIWSGDGRWVLTAGVVGGVGWLLGSAGKRYLDCPW